MKKIFSFIANSQKRQAGFTMIELILYMGIFSILLVVLLQIFSSTLSVHAESQATSSLDQDSNYIFSRLAYDIHRASSIQAPALGTTGNTLQLLVNGSVNTYSIVNGTLQLTGSPTSGALTSNDTSADVQFTKIGNTDPGSKPSVQIQLTLTSKILRDGGRAQSDSWMTTVQTR